MLPKIRYRLVYNYANRLNKESLGLIAVECRQAKKKVYLSTKILISPSQWDKSGMVINHPNAEKLTAYIVQFRNSLEEIELNALLKGKRISLSQLKLAVKNGIHESVSISDFTYAVMNYSDRKKCTKKGYESLMRELQQEYGKITLEDISHDWIMRWKTNMHERGLSENTIKGKLKQLKCIIGEAMKRNLIIDDPFRFITIGQMEPRKDDYLTKSEVSRLEKVELPPKQDHIRDAFLFCVYTGCRFGDFKSLKSDNLMKDKLIVNQQKTKAHVEIPIKTLFGGKALNIISKYPSIEQLANIGHNSTANKTLKEITTLLHFKKTPHWHCSRKTCATLLNQAGLQMHEIQYILGHSQLAVTEKYYATTAFSQVDKSLKKAFHSPSL